MTYRIHGITDHMNIHLYNHNLKRIFRSSTKEEWQMNSQLKRKESSALSISGAQNEVQVQKYSFLYKQAMEKKP